MKWSPQQERALTEISAWLHNPDQQVFYLAGYAGTGKTTLAKEIASKIKGTVLACAYTGKAAQVLRRKGLTMANTIHGLIYNPRDRSRLHLNQMRIEFDLLMKEQPSKEREQKLNKLAREIRKEEINIGKPAFSLDEESPVRTATVTIIDECSMVDEHIGQDLMSFGSKLLVIGDPGQLPPIHGGGYFTEQHPDMELTEIHRQAWDNPIIRMATKVREGYELALGNFGASLVTRKTTCDFRTLFSQADQILVGMHVTRRKINSLMREMAGRNNQLPMKGDKLVCLRNDHEIGILNGSLWIVLESKVEDKETSILKIKADDEDKTIDVHVHNTIFLGADLKWYDRIEGVQDFDYGYALTVHKSQGSQWKRVVLCDEWHFNNRKEWLYTGLTRAAEQVTVLR